MTDMKKFEELGLSDILLSALEKKGFEKPSPIQEQTIPMMLSEDNRDIIGQAQTGTGKTAAFGLPILEKLDPSSTRIEALVMTPTRELTIQVANELYELKGQKKLSITTIYGGTPIDKQIKALRQTQNIVVGTPGRLLDHIKRKRLDLSHLKYVVLDEADEMLNFGFIEDIELILSKANPDRKTLLFSATMPTSILKLAKKYMKDYTTLTAKKETLATTLTEQIYLEVRESNKLEALCRIMDVEESFYGLIFCRTKRDVDAVNEKLMHRGYASEAMHGDLSQAQRERVLGKFRKKIATILVVTDVASRGLDISGLSHVINYALPQDAESYVHRVGRTGRAGQSGTAITFITGSESYKLKNIQRVAKTEIKKINIPDVNTIIASKKKRMKQSILNTINDTPEKDYVEFAQSLLETHSAEDAIAGILKMAFEKEFSKDSYTEIKHDSRRPFKENRSRRPSNNNRRSFNSFNRSKGRNKQRSR